MTPGINTLLLSTGALGSFTCSGMTLLIYMGPTALRGIRATGDTLSNVESQVFTPYKFGITAGDRTPDLLTTRPTCYHSATALCSLGNQICLTKPVLSMEHHFQSTVVYLHILHIIWTWSGVFDQYALCLHSSPWLTFSQLWAAG